MLLGPTSFLPVMLLDNSRSSWIAPPDGLEQKSAGVREDGSMSHSAWAAVTKNHKLGGSSNRKLLSYSSGGWKSKFKVLVLAPFLAFRPPFHCVHTRQRDRERERDLPCLIRPWSYRLKAPPL